MARKKNEDVNNDVENLEADPSLEVEDTGLSASDANDMGDTGEGDDFLSADITVEDRTYGPQYPIVQWINGQPGRKREGGLSYEGGFLAATEQGVEIPGAVATTFVTREGHEIEGQGIRNLKIAILRTRRSWSVTPEKGGGLPLRFAHSEYDEACAAGKSRGQLHVLCVAQGMDEPVVLTFRGYGARAVAGQGQGKDRGAIPVFGQMVLGAANRAARKDNRKNTYPACAFWMTLGPQVDVMGTPVHTKVGKGDQTSLVTLPAWMDRPETVDRDYLNSHYVGHVAFKGFQELFAAADAWVEEWGAEKLAARRAAGAKKPVTSPTVNGQASEAASGLPGGTEVPF